MLTDELRVALLNGGFSPSPHTSRGWSKSFKISDAAVAILTLRFDRNGALLGLSVDTQATYAASALGEVAAELRDEGLDAVAALF